MLKVTEKRGPITTSLADIPVGTVFSGRVGISEPSIFLKVFERVVNLNDPSRTWSGDPGIEDFKPLDAELIVKSK